MSGGWNYIFVGTGGDEIEVLREWVGMGQIFLPFCHKSRV